MESTGDRSDGVVSECTLGQLVGYLAVLGLEDEEMAHAVASLVASGRVRVRGSRLAPRVLH